jgi:hypothetical protein
MGVVVEAETSQQVSGKLPPVSRTSPIVTGHASTMFRMTDLKEFVGYNED